MFRRLTQKLLQAAYPERNLEVTKIGKQLCVVYHDCLGYLDYSLQGRYSYKEVEKLNKLTQCSVRYGYCEEKGPIAIIGIPNERTNWKYFKEVAAYGEITTAEEFQIKEYEKETAKHIGNYMVYGLNGIEEIASFVKFDKISFAYDLRFKEVRISHEYRVLKMKAKLEGNYSFKEAENLANKQQRWAVDRGMAYATLEDGRHVAIISFWYEKRDEVAGFRDVWEYGKVEPPTQKITFMTDEEAASIEDFSIYLYDYQFYIDYQEGPHIVKLDRTFKPGFDFYSTPSDKDMRLFGQF